MAEENPDCEQGKNSSQDSQYELWINPAASRALDLHPKGLLQPGRSRMGLRCLTQSSWIHPPSLPVVPLPLPHGVMG